jgi:hypothetical protein
MAETLIEWTGVTGIPGRTIVEFRDSEGSRMVINSR